jgi:hypothetical protein
VTTPLIVFVTSTVHSKVAPPPFPVPLHWSTTVIRSVDAVGPVLEQTKVGRSFAAPKQVVSVTVELVAPVAMSRVLAITTWHSTAVPPPPPIPLH